MKFIGQRIRATVMTLAAARATGRSSDAAKIAAQIIISIMIVAAGIYFLGWSTNEFLRQVSTGWIGLVIGYWLS